MTENTNRFRIISTQRRLMTKRMTHELGVTVIGGNELWLVTDHL